MFILSVADLLTEGRGHCDGCHAVRCSLLQRACAGAVPCFIDRHSFCVCHDASPCCTAAPCLLTVLLYLLFVAFGLFVLLLLFLFSSTLSDNGLTHRAAKNQRASIANNRNYDKLEGFHGKFVRKHLPNVVAAKWRSLLPVVVLTLALLLLLLLCWESCCHCCGCCSVISLFQFSSSTFVLCAGCCARVCVVRAARTGCRS